MKIADTSFKDVVSINLKACKNGLYIIYVIDTFTRLPKVEFIKERKASAIRYSQEFLGR